MPSASGKTSCNYLVFVSQVSGATRSQQTHKVPPRGPTQQGPFPQAQNQVSEGVLQSQGPTTQTYPQHDPRVQSQQQTREHYLQQQQQQQQQQYIQQQQYMHQLQQQQQFQYQMQYQQQVQHRYMQQQQQQQLQMPAHYQQQMPETKLQQPTTDQGYCPQSFATEDGYCPVNEDYSFNPFYSYMKEQGSFPEAQEEAATQGVPGRAPPNTHQAQEGERFHPSHNRSLSDPRAAMVGAGAVPQNSINSQLAVSKMAYRSHHRSPSDPSFSVRKPGDSQVTGQLVSFESVDETKENVNPFSPFYDGNKANVGLCTGSDDVDDDDFASLRIQEGTSSNKFVEQRTDDHEDSQLQSKDFFGASVNDVGTERNVTLNSVSQETIPTNLQQLENLQPLGNTDLNDETKVYNNKMMVNRQTPDPFGSVPFGSDVPPQHSSSPSSPDIFGQAPFQKSERRQKKTQQIRDGGVSSDFQSSSRSDMFGLQPFSAGSHLDTQPNNTSSFAGDRSESDTKLYELNSSGNKQGMDEFGAASFSGNVQRKDSSFETGDSNSGVVNLAAVIQEQDDPFSGVPFNPTISSKTDKLARRNARRAQNLSQSNNNVTKQAGGTRTKRQLPQLPTNQTADQKGQHSSVKSVLSDPVKQSGVSPRLIRKKEQKSFSGEAAYVSR